MKQLKVFPILIQTAMHGYRISNAEMTERNQIKASWAKEVLKQFSFQTKVVGVPPPAGPGILVGNHVSYLDIPVVLNALPEVNFIAKSDVKRWPIIGSSAAAAGTLFVDRQKGSDRSKIRQGISSLIRDLNQKVVVFPSGTTSLKEDKIWKSGIFEIAKQANIPVYLFKIDYDPIRESAYIDDDNLISQMFKILKVGRKSATLTWMDSFNQIVDPAQFSEVLRQKVRATQ